MPLPYFPQIFPAFPTHFTTLFTTPYLANGGHVQTNSEQLRGLHHDVQAGGKFERKEAIALLTIVIDIAEKLEEVQNRIMNATENPSSEQSA